MPLVAAGAPAPLQHQVLPHAQRRKGPEQVGGDRRVQAAAESAFFLQSRNHLTAAFQAMVQAVLPSALGCGIVAAHGVQGACDGPDARIEARLQGHHGAERGQRAAGLAHTAQLLFEMALLVGTADQGEHQVSAVGEVQVDGLPGDTRGRGDFRHGDACLPALGHQRQGGVQDALARVSA